MSTHQFTIDADQLFLNKKVDIPRFTKEIQDSPDITVALDTITIVERNCVVTFKADISEAEDEALLDIVRAHTGTVLVPPIQAVELYSNTSKVPTSQGSPIVTTEKIVGSSYNSFSHDWCHKTTWYSNATRVVDETLSDSGDHKTYEFAHENVIDTFHGLLTGEDFLKDANGNSFRVVVKVDGVTKTETDPHTGTGDYVIDYVGGDVTFTNTQSPSAVVTATHHYAGSSVMLIKPAAGKILVIQLAEIQFSTDMQMLDSVVYQPKGLVDVFAPQLVGNGQGQIPSGTKIPLGDPFTYKTMRDFFNDAFRSYPTYPAMSTSNWRGLQNGVVIFDWDYLQGKPLHSAYGMEIECKLQHDIPFTGEFATVTFYCSSKDE